MTLEEAHEFLRLIQQSQFKVVEQLNKTLARNSRRFRNVSVGDSVKIFNRSSSFIVRSSMFFGLQSVSTPNRATPRSSRTKLS